MLKAFSFILLIACFISCSTQKHSYPRIIIQTTAGDIEAELYQDKAPSSVNAFLSYINKDYYKNSSFYRILNDDNQPSNAPKSELIQGGLWQSNYTRAKSLPGVPHESTQQTGITHKDGTLSLARRDTGTATSEFFICVGDQPGFDYGGENNPDKQGYAAFGKVINGMDVVRKIYNRPENDQLFTPPVVIINIKRE